MGAEPSSHFAKFWSRRGEGASSRRGRRPYHRFIGVDGKGDNSPVVTPPPPFDPDHPRNGPPRDWLPASLPLDVILARTDAVALALGGFSAYPTCLTFTLTAIARQGNSLPLTFSGPARPAMPDPTAKPGVGGVMWRSSSDADLTTGLGGLHLDVAHPNGGSATWRGHLGQSRDVSQALVVLRSMRGGGGTSLMAQSYFLWPLPTAGMLTIGCEWRDASIERVAIDIECSQFAEAASRAVALWAN